MSLIKVRDIRVNERMDNKQFEAAIDEYNAALELLKTDGEKADDMANYPEHVDTFIGRSLAN